MIKSEPARRQLKTYRTKDSHHARLDSEANESRNRCDCCESMLEEGVFTATAIKLRERRSVVTTRATVHQASEMTHSR